MLAQSSSKESDDDDDSNSLLLPLVLSLLLSPFSTWCCSWSWEWGFSNSSMSGLFVSDGTDEYGLEGNLIVASPVSSSSLD